VGTRRHLGRGEEQCGGMMPLAQWHVCWLAGWVNTRPCLLSGTCPTVLRLHSSDAAPPLIQPPPPLPPARRVTRMHASFSGNGGNSATFSRNNRAVNSGLCSSAGFHANISFRISCHKPLKNNKEPVLNNRN
jgi:hypothetical protein